jgi:hypothetical protein
LVRSVMGPPPYRKGCERQGAAEMAGLRNWQSLARKN